MTTETSIPIVDAPANEPAATKNVAAQLQLGNEALSEMPVETAVEDSVASCDTFHESSNGDAPLKAEEDSSKKESVDIDAVTTESPLVDINEKQQGIKTDSLNYCFHRLCTWSLPPF